jgi:hypothetical protein
VTDLLARRPDLLSPWPVRLIEDLWERWRRIDALVKSARA